MMMKDGGFGVNGTWTGDCVEFQWSAPLSRRKILDARKTCVGEVVGALLPSKDYKLLSESVELGTNIDTIEEFELNIVTKFLGSFVIQTIGDMPKRLYPDVGYGLSLVFDPGSRRVGSSPYYILDDVEYNERFCVERYRRLADCGINGAILGSMTAHEGVFRILPNHYLDLETWKTGRFWPTEDLSLEWLDLNTGSELLASGLRRYIAGAVHEFSSVAVALTGGSDSRLLLAASQDFKKNISFVTLSFGSETRRDVSIAQDIASRFSLDHNVLSVEFSNISAAQRWDRLVGHAIKEMNRKTHTSLEKVGVDVLLTGVFGEIGRCRAYKKEKEEIQNLKATPKMIAARLAAPLDVSETFKEIEQWLAALPMMPTSKILDLAMFELRFAPWGVGQAPVQRAMQFELTPYAQYDVLRAFINTPPELKSSSGLFFEAGARLWPNVMKIPINAYGDYRDQIEKLRPIFSSSAWQRRLRTLRG